MSGGKWNYGQCNLGYEMFPNSLVSYGLGKYTYNDSIREARKINPMEDKQISELIFDTLCLICSADWYKSGDIGEDTYREDVQFFKNKWLKTKYDNLIKQEIDKSIKELKTDLYKEFLIKEQNDNE